MTHPLADSLFHDFIDHLPVGFYRATPDGRILEANPALQSLLGCEDREALLWGNVKTLYVRVGDRELFQELLARDGVVRGFEMEVRRADGSIAWTRQSARLLRDQQGNSVCYEGVIEDISAQKEAEASVREEMQLISLHLEMSKIVTQSDLLADMLLQCAETLVRYLDAAFARIWTVNATGDVLELQASAGMYIHVDGAHSRIPVGQFKIGRIAQERQPHLTNNVLGDPLVHDQAWARREGMVAFAGYPLLVEERLVGVMGLFARKPLAPQALDAMGGVANDIAVAIEKKRLESILRHNEARLRAIFDSAAVGIGFVDAEGHFLETNAALARMLGYSKEELLQHTFSDVTYPDDMTADLDLYVALTVGERDSYQIEKRYVRKNGETFWGRLTVSRAAGAGGGRFAVGIIEDISGRKQMEELERSEKDALAALVKHNVILREKAEQAARLEADFLATISHELRTPLNIILGYTSLLLEDDFGAVTSEQRVPLVRIDKSAQRLLKLISVMLDAKDLGAGKFPLLATDLNLAEFLDQLVSELQEQMSEKPNLELQWQGLSEPLTSRTDPLALKILLRNILENAIKFTDQGRVSLVVTSDDTGVEFSISDTGVGIAPEIQTHLFDLFHQGGNTLTRCHEGIGLGLYIVQQLVELLGGKITVHSEIEQGSTFRVWIPLKMG